MKIDLKNKKCESCSGSTLKLNSTEIINYLSYVENWTVNQEQEALDFTNSVSLIAEEEKHHPDISFGWGYCIIMIHTHAIKGLSINDFILAAKIDQLNYEKKI